MASKTIKGLTVEIGGDTTKLGKALKDVEAKSRGLSKELGDINKLLKLDPGNTELLAQKMKVLKEAVASSAEKLNTLKEAERQVQEQFERGEVSEEQVRALQREIVVVANKMKGYENAVAVTAEAMENLGKAGDDAGSKSKTLTQTIADQETKLKQLKARYVEVVAAEGENSDSAKGLAREIGNLSSELKDNKDKMADAEKAADKAAGELDDYTDSAEEAEKTSSRLGSALSGTLKAGLIAVASAAAAAGAAAYTLGKSVVSAYADTEQLVGGVETLFGAGGMTLKEYAESVNQSEEAIKKFQKEHGLVVDGIIGKNTAKAMQESYKKMQAAEKKVLKNANDAYKKAGLSANEYMETVTSFSASLISSLGGDTEKAADIADKAIVDMSDNANKMGSSMTDIQNAYQGFAKQNYTMLDNLKLGYGGTKEEMERLLADAQAISGIKYDISSYSDVIEAIHVIQTEMGITGTTAKEAEGTISGSISTMKAAFSNLIAGLGDSDANVAQLCENVINAFRNVVTNITPVVQNIIQALPTLVETAMTALSELLPTFATTAGTLFSSILTNLVEMLPSFASAAVDLVSTLVSALLAQLPTILSTGGQLVAQLLTGIASGLPGLLQTAVDLFTQFTASLQTGLPGILATGSEILMNLVTGIANSLPSLVSQALDALMQFATTLYDNAPSLIETGFNMLSKLVEGIINCLPALIAKGPELISKFANIINDNFPTILAKGAELLWQIIKGIVSVIPDLIANAGDIIKAIVDVWQAFNWLQLGKQAITWLKNGITGMISAVKGAGKNVLESITNVIKNLPQNLLNFGKNAVSNLGTALKSGLSTVKGAATSIFNGVVDVVKSLPSKLLSIGKDLITGLWNGISDKTGWIIDKVGGFVDSVVSRIKNFFGIASPSKVMRDEVGKWLPEGMAVGIEKNAESATGALEGMAKDAMDAANAELAGGLNIPSVNGIALERSLQQRSAQQAAAVASTSSADIFTRLDKILTAIERGQVLTIDGKKLVGGTAAQYDASLGQRRALVARGAI